MSLTSIFNEVKTAEHTFVAWAEKEFQAIEKNEPAVEKIADTALTYAKMILPTILVAEGDPVAAAIALKTMNQAQNDMTAVQGVITDVGASPTVASKIASISTNIGTLLTVGQVKDPKSAANITNVVNSLASVATAIANAATPPPPAPAS